MTLGVAGGTAVETAAAQTADGADAPLLLVVDGDGLLHRAHHGIGGGDHDRDGRPTWALRGLVTSFAVAAARLRPDVVLVALDSRVDPVRKAMYAGYKAHRPPRPPDLAEQLEAAPDLLARAGVPYARVDGHEGDDVLASGAALARREGWRCVLVTSDRDAFALVDPTTSVLRVGAGGVEAASMLTPDRIASAYGVSPQQYRDLAALRGDTSDNLPGVPGIGAKTASKLLRAFGSVDAAFAAIDAGRLVDVELAIGTGCAARLAEQASREAVLRNQRLMTMRIDLPLPDAAELRLPLDRPRLTKALRQRGIGLGRSLWALVGGEPPPWEPNGYDTVPRALPKLVAAPWTSRVMPSIAELATMRGMLRQGLAGAASGPAPARPVRGRRQVRVCEDQLELF